MNYITPTKVQGPPGTKVVPATPTAVPSPSPAAAGGAVPEAPKERAAAVAAPTRWTYISFGDYGTINEWFSRP